MSQPEAPAAPEAGVTHRPIVAAWPLPPEEQETWTEKATRKFKQNPWVPLGLFATAGAFVMASIKFKQGEHSKLNYWLRWRVVLQGITVLALVQGAGSYTVKNVKKAADEQDRFIASVSEEKREEERRRFAQRLAEAEENERIDQIARNASGKNSSENEGGKSRNWWKPW
ncbi:hypoxia induced protein conserved region-domain-containing protein [Schizophyllum amplum]|uniref:Hypoxia induced protein conserved region-domain-containing protein n=1 Tax=Schizophyllum amplum TaxID=97359 RepID=A0A550CQ16_9AGAR|nr:hypoxia induced protein conserved region-domain-containing protein [Auriculariopsis ampla]